VHRSHRHPGLSRSRLGSPLDFSKITGYYMLATPRPLTRESLSTHVDWMSVLAVAYVQSRCIAVHRHPAAQLGGRPVFCALQAGDAAAMADMCQGIQQLKERCMAYATARADDDLL